MLSLCTASSPCAARTLKKSFLKAGCIILIIEVSEIPAKKTKVFGGVNRSPQENRIAGDEIQWFEERQKSLGYRIRSGGVSIVQFDEQPSCYLQ